MNHVFFKSKEEREQQKRERLKKLDSSAIFGGYTLQPIGKIQLNAVADLSLIPDKACLNISHNDINITLPYERIISFKVDCEVNLINSGNTLGRAIAGGALFGSTGAIVGAISSKGDTQNRWVATLQYKDKEGNIQQLHFLERKVFGIYDGSDKSFLARNFENAVNRIVSNYAENITEL